MALLLGAFLVGAALAFVLGMLRELGRTYHDYQRVRHARRAETLNEIYQRGVAAQLAARAADAVQAYEEVLRREPAHAEAPIRLGELAPQRGDALAALNHLLPAVRSEGRTETLLTVADHYRSL